jgi:hypothetical protein
MSSYSHNKSPQINSFRNNPNKYLTIMTTIGHFSLYLQKFFGSFTGPSRETVIWSNMFVILLLMTPHGIKVNPFLYHLKSFLNIPNGA